MAAARNAYQEPMPHRDQTDLQIIDCLRRDPRMSNKDLAKEIGIAETTVAARVRSLRDDGVARVVAQMDVRKLGYDLISLVDVHVSGVGVREVAENLAKLEEISSVCICAGSPAIIVQINARNRTHTTEILYEKIAAVPGVTEVVCNLITRMYKFKSEWGTLS